MQILHEVIVELSVYTFFLRHLLTMLPFGFEWFENLCKQYQTEIVVLNHEETSPDKELVEDLMSIVDAFSSRLGWLRKYKNVIKEDRGR